MTTKFIERLEQKMQDMDENSVRYQILHYSKNFKSSWISLGQALYTVWKEKSYRDWGYDEFDTYTSKEIGIRKPTALKLLKSYRFLEKEEPGYLRHEYQKNAKPSAVPTVESVDLLRKAHKKKELDQDDYKELKTKLLDSGKDVGEVKKSLTALIRQRQEIAPEEVWQKKRSASIRRLMGTLRSLNTELKSSKAVSAQALQMIEKLIDKLESESED